MKTMPGADELTMLCTALECVGLPADPRQVIGRMYQYTYNGDYPQIILVGTITAISIDDSRSVTLYVSNPYFQADKVLGIVASQIVAGREQTQWFLSARSKKEIKELWGKLILI